MQISNQTTSKKMLKKTLIMSFFCLSSVLLSGFFNPILAQDGANLAQRLPADVMGVIAINAENYTKKGDLDKLMELEFMKDFDKKLKESSPNHYDLISKIYKNPKQAGINLFPKSYAFALNLDSLTAFGYIFNVSDRGKLDELANKIVADSKEKIFVGEKKGFKFFSDNKTTMAWNGQIAVMMGIEGTQKYNSTEVQNYDDPDYYAKQEEKERLYTQKKGAVMATQIELIIEGQKSNVTTNANFQLFNNQVFDAGVWINYQVFNSVFSQYFKELRGAIGTEKKMMEKFASVMKDNYLQMFFNVNKGNATFAVHTYMGEKMTNLSQGLYDKRINPKFFDYVDGTNTLGFLATAIDMRKYYDLFMGLYMPFLEDVPQGKKIISAIELAGIGIDEDAVLNLFKGDLMFAITDVRDVNVTYKDYEYDGDKYVGEVEKTKKEQNPVFVAMSSIGNQKNVDILVRALVNFELIKEQKGYYEFTKTSGIAKIYLVMKDGIFIISNDENLVLGRIVAGKTVAKPVESRLQDLTKSNSQVFFTSFPNVFNTILKTTKLNKEEKKNIEELKNNIGELQFKGIEMNGKVAKYDATIDLKNKKENSLYVALKMIDIFMKSGQVKATTTTTDTAQPAEKTESVEEKPKKRKKGK